VIDVAAVAIRVVSVCIAALLVLALVHKARVIAMGGAAREPLMQFAWRRPYASVVLGFAGAVELAIAVLLLVTPSLGLGGALVLLAIYSWEVRRLPSDQPCNCFGRSLLHTRDAALQRNLILAVFCVAAFVPSVTGAVTAAPISQATIGAALIVLAARLPFELLPRITNRASILADPRTGGRTGAP
jgi:methylamine utilization protein MauE